MVSKYIASVLLSSSMTFFIVESGEPMLLGVGSGIIIFIVLTELAEIRNKLKNE